MLKPGDLTFDNLRKVALPEDADSIYFNDVWEEIKRDVRIISSTYDRQEEFVIYCFIKLSNMNLVIKYNYYQAFEDNKKLLHQFDKEYQGRGFELRSFRLPDNIYSVYGEEFFNYGFATTSKKYSYLIAKDLYRDEAIKLSDTLRIEKIFHTVNKENDRYEINVDMQLVIKSNREERLIFALQNFIIGITFWSVEWVKGSENKLKVLEDGRLERITSRDDTESCIEIVDKLAEYIQNTLKD